MQRYRLKCSLFSTSDDSVFPEHSIPEKITQDISLSGCFGIIDFDGDKVAISFSSVIDLIISDDALVFARRLPRQLSLALPHANDARVGGCLRRGVERRAGNGVRIIRYADLVPRGYSAKIEEC